jgi:putative NADH-flavin reductase
VKIFLLGANGRTGREVLGRALSAGDSVTALVRAKDRLAEISHERLEVCVGNPCDARALELLLPGHDVVVSVLGPRRPWKSATAIYPESGAAIVAAMQRSDVNRLLVTSSGLLFPQHGFFLRALRWLVRSMVADAGRMEEQIRSSSLDWTIARTSFLTNDSAASYRLAVGALPEGGGSISRVAVASFLLAEAEQLHHVRQVVGICG